MNLTYNHPVKELIFVNDNQYENFPFKIDVHVMKCAGKLNDPLACMKIYIKAVKLNEFPWLRRKHPEVVGRAYYAIRMVRRIRNWWTHIYYSPETDVGRRRLEREMNSLAELGILSDI